MNTLKTLIPLVGALGLLVAGMPSAHATPKPKTELPVSASASTLTAATASTSAAETDTGLVPVKVRGFDQAALLPEVHFGRYRTFLVTDPTLEFDRHWLREFRRDMSERDEQRIRDRYGDAVKTALEEALASQLGWQAVSEPTEDTLIVNPNLTQFRLTAPDLTFRARSRDYVHYAGSARLQLTLRDAASDTLIGELSDYSQTQSWGGIDTLKPTNRVVNLRDFQTLSRRWARQFSDYLNTHREAAAQVQH